MTRTNRECITFGFSKRFVFYIFSRTAKKKKKPLRSMSTRGRAGIEPATSPTRRENHTSRPTAQSASSEDRTRDLALTKRMLCQLSYRGDPHDRALRKKCIRSVNCKTQSQKVHARRDSNPQPPDSKSGALSIAPRALDRNAAARATGLGSELQLAGGKKKLTRHLRDSNSRGQCPIDF